MSSSLVFLFNILLLLVFVNGQNPSVLRPTLVVPTTLGPVDGHILKSSSPNPNAPSVRFWGSIPFAASTAGSNRFRPPQPKTPWVLPLETTNGSYVIGCPQVTSYTFTQTEDCLVLNVISPLNAVNLPVMVWIHGGSLRSGAGGYFDGSALVAENNVVFVSINYRVGFLGFMGLDALAAEPGNNLGNYGFLDQQLGLKWVTANIANFGGNPNAITIFGESAGALSVVGHLTSPTSTASNGIHFRSAIVESYYEPGAFWDRTATNFYAQQEILQTSCAPLLSQPADLLNCLRTVSYSEFVDNALPAGLSSFGLTIDGVNIVGLPSQLVPAGRWARVPILQGTNLNEFSFILCPAFYNSYSTLSLTTVDLFTSLFFSNSTFVQSSVNTYAPNYPTPYDAGVALFSDAIFKCPTRTVVAGASQDLINQAPSLLNDPDARFIFNNAYMYSLEYVPSFSNPCFGVAHGFDVPFIFPFAYTPVGAVYSAADTALGVNLRATWASFAYDPRFGPSLAALNGFTHPFAAGAASSATATPAAAAGTTGRPTTSGTTPRPATSTAATTTAKATTTAASTTSTPKATTTAATQTTSRPTTAGPTPTTNAPYIWPSHCTSATACEHNYVRISYNPNSASNTWGTVQNSFRESQCNYWQSVTPAFNAAVNQPGPNYLIRATGLTTETCTGSLLYSVSVQNGTCAPINIGPVVVYIRPSCASDDTNSAWSAYYYSDSNCQFPIIPDNYNSTNTTLYDNYAVGTSSQSCGGVAFPSSSLYALVTKQTGLSTIIDCSNTFPVEGTLAVYPNAATCAASDPAVYTPQATLYSPFVGGSCLPIPNPTGGAPLSAQVQCHGSKSTSSYSFTLYYGPTCRDTVETADTYIIFSYSGSGSTSCVPNVNFQINCGGGGVVPTPPTVAPTTLLPSTTALPTTTVTPTTVATTTHTPTTKTPTTPLPTTSRLPPVTTTVVPTSLRPSTRLITNLPTASVTPRPDDISIVIVIGNANNITIDIEYDGKLIAAISLVLHVDPRYVYIKSISIYRSRNILMDSSSSSSSSTAAVTVGITSAALPAAFGSSDPTVDTVGVVTASLNDPNTGLSSKLSNFVGAQPAPSDPAPSNDSNSNGTVLLAIVIVCVAVGIVLVLGGSYVAYKRNQLQKQNTELKQRLELQNHREGFPNGENFYPNPVTTAAPTSTTEMQTV